MAIAKVTRSAAGYRKGYPRRFALSHSSMFSHREKTEYRPADVVQEIPLTQGKVAIVDRDDFESLSQYRWQAYTRGNTWYAKRVIQMPDGKQATLHMHRDILNAPKGTPVDHRDGNGLNNTRANLRLCTAQENNRNSRRRKDASSRYKGVQWYKPGTKWKAQIEDNGRHKHLGYFASEEEAARAYDAAALELYGEFARFNFVDAMKLALEAAQDEPKEPTE